MNIALQRQNPGGTPNFIPRAAAQHGLSLHALETDVNESLARTCPALVDGPKLTFPQVAQRRKEGRTIDYFCASCLYAYTVEAQGF